MKKIILSVLAALCISASHAQVLIAPVGGLNVSGYTSELSGLEGGQQRLRLGPCLGALVDFPLQSKLSIQTGLLYKTNGYTSLFNNPFYSPSQYPPLRDDYVQLSVKTLDVPVKLTWSFSTQRGAKFFVCAGPYIGVNIAVSALIHGHKYTSHGTTSGTLDEKIKLAVGEHWGVPRIDFGGGMNVGYRAAKGLLICLQGQYGALNQGDANSTSHNYNFGIVGGYTFKLKKHKDHTEAPKAI